MYISVRSTGNGLSPTIAIQDKSKRSGSGKGQLKDSTQLNCDVKQVRCKNEQNFLSFCLLSEKYQAYLFILSSFY